VKREHRISAGAIILQGKKMLLVRYKNRVEKSFRVGQSFLVGPGGAVNTEESTDRAAVREVMEETGLEVSPLKVLIVEDLLSKHHRITKIWFLCNVTGGQITKTQGAVEEGIIEVGWYSRDQLNDEVVYPTVLKTHQWSDFFKDTWQTICLELQETDF
jgi:8-oxo-dGTP pyrophosphatase MutT (NUDIX family)